MLLVHTFVAPSNIQGIGLFARENIPKGTIIWKWDSRVDFTIHRNELDALPPYAKDRMWTYGWREGAFHLIPGDDARFLNHSKSFNAEYDQKDDVLIATRDINAGEEITEDYSQYDEEFDTYGGSLI